MTIQLIPIDKIVPNKYQTRKSADPDHIRDIADSIKRGRLLQPPTGRQLPDGTVQLAFGHNRLAAFRLLHSESAVANDLAGRDFSAMPIDVQADLNDEAMADFAWDENIHQPLTPLDRARSIQQRVESFGWTHKVAGEHLGLDRATVSNILRLLKLPDDLQAKVDNGELSERQATALLGLYDLPESLIEQAEKDYQNYKPSYLITNAAAFSSDSIRGMIAEIFKRNAVDLKTAIFDLNAIKIFADSEFKDTYPALLANACAGCEFNVKRGDKSYCANPACFRAKQILWKAHRLGLASAALSLPILDGWPTYHSYGGLNTDLHGALSHRPADMEQILASSCENLRLVWNDDTWRDPVFQKFPDVVVTCQKRSGFCTCIKGLDALHKTASQPAAPANVGAPTSLSREAEVEAAMLDPVDPAASIPDPRFPPNQPTAADLKEAAGEARRAERLARKQLEEIMQSASKVLSERLQSLDPGALAWLHKQVVGSYTTIDPNWTASDLFDGIAYIMIKRDYNDGRSALGFIDELRHKFEWAGIPADEVFDVKEGG